MAVDYSRYMTDPAGSMADNTLASLRVMLPSKDEQLRRQFDERRLRLADLELGEKERAISDAARLRSRIEGVRGGYAYPEPGAVGPMPPGEEGSISQLMPQQQPPSRNQLAEIYRDEAMRGNQAAISGVSNIINIDEQLFKMNADPEKMRQFTLGKQMIVDVSSALKNGNPQAAEMLLEQYRGYMPDNPFMAGLTLDKFGITGNGSPVVRIEDPKTGELIGYNVLEQDGMKFQKVEQPKPEYKQRTYNQGGTEITEVSNDGGVTWSKLSTAPRYKPASGGGMSGVAGGGKAPSGYRWTANGELEPIPGGPQAKGGKPLPAGQLESISDMKKVADVLREAQGIANKVDTGPVAGRLQSLGSKVGLSSDTFADFEQKLATAQNIMLKLRSGAAVTDQEYSRFLREYPTPNDPPAVRDRKLRNTINYATNLMNEKLDIYEEGGYKVPRQAAGRTGTPAAQSPAPSRSARPGDDFLRKKGLK